MINQHRLEEVRIPLGFHVPTLAAECVGLHAMSRLLFLQRSEAQASQLEAKKDRLHSKDKPFGIVVTLEE